MMLGYAEGTPRLISAALQSCPGMRHHYGWRNRAPGDEVGSARVADSNPRVVTRRSTK